MRLPAMKHYLQEKMLLLALTVCVSLKATPNPLTPADIASEKPTLSQYQSFAGDIDVTYNPHT
ncbi:hypothetical protein [Rheinheimera gaetbuli]